MPKAHIVYSFEWKDFWRKVSASLNLVPSGHKFFQGEAENCGERFRVGVAGIVRAFGAQTFSQFTGADCTKPG